MFEYEGQQYTLEDLQLEATQRGVSFDHYLKEMKKLGLTDVQDRQLMKVDEELGWQPQWFTDYSMAIARGGVGLMKGVMETFESEKVAKGILAGKTKEQMVEDGTISAGNYHFGVILDELEKYSTKKYDKDGNQADVLTLLEEGRISDAADLGSEQAVSNIFSFVAGGVNPLLGATLIGTSTYGSNFTENIEGRYDPTKMTEEDLDDLRWNSIYKAGAEFAGEYIGARLWRGAAGLTSKGVKSEVVKEYNRGVVNNTLRGFVGGFGSEFISEGMTNNLGQLADMKTFGDEKTYRDFYRGFINDGIIGGLLGGPTAGGMRGTNPVTKDAVYKLAASRKWQSDMLDKSLRVQNAEAELEKASDRTKDVYQKRLDLLKKDKQRHLDKLYAIFDNKSGVEMVTHAKRLDRINKLYDIYGDKKASQEVRKDAEKEIRDLYTEINEDTESFINIDTEVFIGKMIKAREEIDAKKGIRGFGKDLKIKSLKTEDQVQKAIKESGQKELSAADGLFMDGKTKTIYINEVAAAAAGATNVLGHELLHYVFSKNFKTDNASMKPLVDSFKKYLVESGNSAYVRRIEKRMKDNGYFDKDGVIKEGYLEEYFEMFSDLIEKDQMKLMENEKAAKPLAKTWTNFMVGLGFKSVKLETGKDVFDFLRLYTKNVNRKGLYGAITKRRIAGVKLTSSKVAASPEVVSKESKFSKTITDAVDKLGKVDKDGNNLTEKGTGNFYYQAEADDVVKQIKEKGYLDNLIAAKYKADEVPKNFVSDVITALASDIKAFKPEENNSLFGYLQGRITFRAGDVYNKIYKQKEENKGSRQAGETTKEGDVKIQVAAEKSSEMEAFEEEDLSIRGQAKKAKADKQQYSEYRRKLGFETGSKIYNEVLDNVKKSLMMAYGTTQNITDAQLRAKAIATKLKKEYANLNSPLFKQIKNFLTYGVADVYVKRGTKDTYISNLKKFREDIVKNTSTADLVQMERNTPEADRIFTTFVKTLTSVEQVQDAVNREQLPPDALNKITKDKKTGKGAFSPSLYNKIMPTETELVSWADQPRINPVTGLRQGLKGTRKDGLAMRMVNGLVTDAIMEARQSEEVQNKISEMGIDPGSVAELGAAIGREVNVKFSKSNATGDISAAIDGAGDVNVYSQIKFSKSHREAYEKQLNKRRPDLTEDQRKNAVQSVFDFVDGKEIPNNKKSKYEKMAMHYTANGFLILPEDGYKVVEAEKIATQKKLDPFSFKNPNVLIETYVGEVKGTRTNPDNVKTFTNKTELTNGVTIYDVEDSKQGQLDTRKVIDTHFGKKSNPWCLCARSGDYLYTREADTNAEKDSIVKEEKAKGNLVDVYKANEGYEIIIKQQPDKVNELKSSFRLWKNYNKEGNGHQIAFQNGRLVSFRDGNEMQWWDRNDEPSNAVVVKGKKGKDGFKPVIEVGKTKETILAYEKVTGDKKNGTTIKKDLDGDVVFQETKKNGKLNGKRITVKKAGTIDAGSNDYSSMQTENYKDGSRLDFKEERTYTNKKATVKTGFGRDEITLNNITKYERSFQDSKDNIRLPDNEVTTIEGTVKQRYFKEFNDPSSITDGFVKTNLPNLTPAHERYYSIQGQKVKVVSNFEIADKKLEDIQTGNTTTVTINGVEQETRVKFSKSSVNYDLKNTSIKFSKNNKQIRKAIINAGNEIIKLKETNPESSSIDIYNVVQENLNKVDENFTYEEAVGVIELHTKNKYGENASLDVKQLLSKGIDNLIDGLAEVNLDVLREESLPLIASGFNKILNSGFDTAAQEKVLLGLVGYIGRSIRNITVKEGSVTRRGIINTNDKLFKWMDDNLAAIPPALKKALKVIKGKAYGKENVSKILYKNQDIKKFEHVDSIKAALTSTKKTVDKQSVLNTVDGEAITAVRFLEYILGPKSPLNAAEKLAFVELSFIDMMGLMRKTYPAGFYLFGKDHDKSNTKLEHNPPVAEVKEIWAQYAQGKINIDNVLDWYVNNNAKVNVVSNKMADTLSKQGLNTSRKNNQDRYENPVVKAQLKKDAGRGNKNLGNNNINTPHLFKNRDKFQGAIKFSRSANNPTKGITVLDFDDTLATSKSLIIFTRPDGTKGTLNAEQYASTYESLSDLGYKFDFSEFTKVVDGKTAPLFNKAMKLQGKFGPENMFVLTARPAESAAAIHAFLKANGLNIPLKNITGLANSTSEAKALWIADKVGEGYNDFYFADDALQNVQAVKNMLNQFDVKSKVQQAKVKFSKSMNDQFNDILENVTGIESIKRFSIIKGRKRGESKGKFRYFVPPSHEDFVGLLYNFMGKGKEGNKHRDFLEQALVRPLNRANRELDTARQSVANDYKELNKQFEDVKSKFTKKTPDGDFTFQDAIRVYLWDKHGYKIPGLSETDQTKLAELVMSDPQLQAYAETLNVISKQETYVNPTDGWNGGDIRMDLDDATGIIGREQYFSEFIENTSIIFSEENLNKIEAGYGKEVRESLEDMLYRIKTGRNRPTGQNAQVNKLMNYLNGSVGTVMFFNMRSALLQQMSIVNYINFADNNIFAAAKAFANQKQYWADWSFIFNSDMLKQRRGGIQTDVNGAELAASLRNSKDITRKLISKLLELGFLPTQIGDNIAIATGGATYYRNRINTYLKQGLSKKEAEAKAFTDFQDITQSTQQSARPDMVSKQQASVIGKVILNFQNVTSQFNRLGKKAFQDIYNRRITKPNTTQMQSDISNAARITYYFAVQNAIFYTLQTALFAMMFDDDEEDNNNLFLKKRERLINGSVDSVLRGTGLIGGVVATLKNVAIAFARQRDVKYNPDESAVMLEALNLSPVLGIKGRKIVNAEKTLNYNKKVIDEMETFDIDNPQWSAVTNYTEAFTNVPLNRLYNKTQNVRQALNNEHATWERTLMFLGWSQYNLNLENKKMEEIKAKTKKKKKNKGDYKSFKYK